MRFSARALMAGLLSVTLNLTPVCWSQRDERPSPPPPVSRQLQSYLQKSYLELFQVARERTFTAAEIAEMREALKRGHELCVKHYKQRISDYDSQLKQAQSQLKQISDRGDDSGRHDLHCRIQNLRLAKSQAEMMAQKAIPIAYDNREAKLQLIEKWPDQYQQIRQELADGSYRKRRWGDVQDIRFREFAQEITPQTVGCRPGNVLVLASNHYHLHHLAAVLERVNPARRDVVLLHIRELRRSGSGEHDLEPDQLFTKLEQSLFTKALEIAEEKGKPIRLAVVASNDIYDAMVRAAQNLQSSVLVVATSAKMPPSEQARLIGLAWERLPHPKPHFRLEVYSPTGQEKVFYLGPHAPHLTPKEIELLHNIWLRLSEELAPEEVHHHDVVHFALTELEREMTQFGDQEVVQRFREHLNEIKPRRVHRPQ